MRLAEGGDSAMAMQGKAPPSPFQLFVPVWLRLGFPVGLCPDQSESMCICLSPDEPGFTQRSTTEGTPNFAKLSVLIG